MFYLKKLAFAPIFLLFFGFCIYFLKLLLEEPNFILGLDPKIWIVLGLLILALVLTALFFVIFATLASDWKLILPVSLVSCLLPFLLLSNPLNLIVLTGCFLSFVLSNISLEGKLKTYIDFQPSVLLVPVVKTVISFMIIVLTISYFINSNLNIQRYGFQLPDSLIDTTLKLVSPAQQTSETNQDQVRKLKVTKQQIAILRKNPDTLKQYGIDPSVLDTLEEELNKQVFSSNKKEGTSGQKEQDLLKPLVKKQLQEVITPYLPWIAPILTLFFYLTVISLSQFLALFTPLLVSLIFFILEKTSFITFVAQMREIRKMEVK